MGHAAARPLLVPRSPIAPRPARYPEYPFARKPVQDQKKTRRKMQGKLELMMGPMRSNKTAELLRRADMRRQYAKQHVLVLKPSDDTKGGPGVVESRNPNGGGKMDAITFNSTNPWEVLQAIRDKEQEIGKRV